MITVIYQLSYSILSLLFNENSNKGKITYNPSLILSDISFGHKKMKLGHPLREGESISSI